MRRLEKAVNQMFELVSTAPFQNLVGNPSVSIPFTREEGMPVGLLLDAKIYHDKKLLSHALYFEKLIGAKRD